MYDVAIIGAGVAGLTAALFSSRRELKTAVISQSNGGQLPNIPEIENWPGEELISGLDLSNKIYSQVAKYPVDFKYSLVLEIKKDGENFLIKTTGEEIKSKTVILAYGKSPGTLKVKGEDEFKGRGVSYCVNCDGQFFKEKDVAVVGGGNAALEAAITMSKIASRVYLIHRRDSFRAEDILISKTKKLQNVEMLLNEQIIEIYGDKAVQGIKTASGKEIKLSGIFVEIGSVADDALVKNLVKTDESKHVVINADQSTSCPGVFAAGDMTDYPFKQLIIASGQGASAALSAVRFLHSKK